MKFLFLHLSDLHLVNATTFPEEKINAMLVKIENEIVKNEITCCAIIFSGDLTYSGKAEQFNLVSSLIRRIRRRMSRLTGNSWVDTLLVPGNHDIDFFEKSLSREEALTMKKDEESFIKFYDKKLKNFFENSTKHKIFLHETNIDLVKSTAPDLDRPINYILLNSTYGSLFKDKNDDHDEGLHLLTEIAINAFKKVNEKDMNILITHFTHSFFDSQSSSLIEDFVHNKCDFVFFGHQHINGTLQTYSRNNKFIYSCGGPLFEEGTSIFNTVIFDPRTKEFFNNKFTWSEENQTFFSEANGASSIRTKTNIRQEFFDLTSKADTELNGAGDIYVFPELVSSEEHKEYRTENEIMSHLDNCDGVVNIKGYDRSGKTTLAKYIYKHFACQDKYPFFIDGNEPIKNFQNYFRIKYNEQFDGGKTSYELFVQKVQKENRILVVDDFDKFSIDDQNKILNFSKDFFGKAIVFSNDSSSYCVSADALINKLEYGTNETLEIQPFLLRKRNDLLGKIIKTINPELSLVKTTKLVEEMNKTIIEQISIVAINPEFLTLFATSFLKTQYQSAGGQIFNKVFESNIVTSIHHVYSGNVDPFIRILQKIAYFCFSKQQKDFSQENLNQIINEYNNSSKYKRHLLYTDVSNVLLSSKIIKTTDSGGKYSFASNSFYCYFVAKEMVVLYKNQDASFKPFFDDISENITERLNGEILLFLCYLVDEKDTVIIKHILNKASKHFNDFDELTFENSNVPFLFSRPLPAKKENEISKEGRRKFKEEVTAKKESGEKKDLLRLEKANAFEANCDATLAKIVKGFKYIDLLSKILPDFINMLDDDDLIYECAKSIYEFSNKFLFQIFTSTNEMVDSKFEKVIGGINTKDDFQIDENAARAGLLSIAYQTIRTLYNHTALMASNKDTIIALNAVDSSQSFTKQIQKLFMQSYVDDEAVFVPRFKKVLAEYKTLFSNQENFVGRLLDDVLWAFFNRNEIPFYKHIQSLFQERLNSRNSGNQSKTYINPNPAAIAKIRRKKN